MNQLENTLTTLEVAEMVGKNHKEVLRDIRKIIEQSGQRKVALTYFQEDTYEDVQGKSQPMYRVTKKGCEIFGNRMAGVKGTQFTFGYVERFNQMEKHIKQQPDISNLSPELQMFNQMFQAVANQEQKLIEVNDKVDNISEIVEFRNNEEKQGDYEQNLSQIDGYNILQTDRIQDKKNFVKAIMILYGFTLPEEKPAEINGSMVVQAPSKEEGATAEFVSNTFTESEVQTLADSILGDFHKTTYVPNLNDEQFAGNISGEAMKYKLFGLLLVLSIKIGYLEDGIIQRLRLLQNILNVKGQNVDSEGTVIKFKPNLPINRSDIIQQIRDSQEFMPLLVSLGWLDDIDNPQEIIDMMNKQKEEDIKLNQKVMGIQSEDSHSNLDDPPDDNEEGSKDGNNKQKDEGK